MAYNISKSTDVTKVIEQTVVIDTAFHRAADLSKAHFGSVFVVWVPDGKGGRLMRIFAQAGVARWARPCTAKVMHHYGCHVCGGLGLVEDCAS